MKVVGALEREKEYSNSKYILQAKRREKKKGKQVRRKSSSLLRSQLGLFQDVVVVERKEEIDYSNVPGYCKRIIFMIVCRLVYYYIGYCISDFSSLLERKRILIGKSSCKNAVLSTDTNLISNLNISQRFDRN